VNAPRSAPADGRTEQQCANLSATPAVCIFWTEANSSEHITTNRQIYRTDYRAPRSGTLTLAISICNLPTHGHKKNSGELNWTRCSVPVSVDAAGVAERGPTSCRSCAISSALWIVCGAADPHIVTDVRHCSSSLAEAASAELKWPPPSLATPRTTAAPNGAARAFVNRAFVNRVTLS